MTAIATGTRATDWTESPRRRLDGERGWPADASPQTARAVPWSRQSSALPRRLLRRLGRNRRSLISWTWAVNGFASVIASIVAVMISMKWGFASTLFAGSLCYLLAAGCILLQPED